MVNRCEAKESIKGRPETGKDAAVMNVPSQLSGLRFSFELCLLCPDPTQCRVASGAGFLSVTPTMACTPPASASEVFCRAAKCNRLMGRVLFVFATFLTVVLVSGSTEFIRNSSAGNVGSAERIVGHLTSFVAQLILVLSVLFLARRRSSAAHHAQVKSNNLKALELLAASATDEATKKDLLARSADLVAGKQGCCK